MDLFDAPEIGSARAIGTKHGNVAGTSVDVLYPESKLVKEQFKAGRVLNFKWKADKHRWWHPRNTRLTVDYEIMFGEVKETAESATSGALERGTDDAIFKGAPPASSVPSLQRRRNPWRLIRLLSRLKLN